MQMKSIYLKLIFVVVAVMVMISGCDSKEADSSTMEKIQKQLTELNSYECTAKLTRISNKGENVYQTKQYFKITGEYRLELTAPEKVKGNFTVYDGKQVCQYNPRIGGRVVAEVPPDKARNELFLGQFLKNYMQSEGVSVATAQFDDSNCTVLEAVVPGDDKYLASEKLWVDNKTLEPVKFVIYDQEGTERYIVEYDSFTYNAAIEDTLFKMPE